jgi:hypothetical protein
MKCRVAAFTLSAWIVLCGFQQPPSPQGETNHKTANATHAKASTTQPNALPTLPSSASNADAQSNGIESHGKQNIQVVSAAPKQSIDPVEHVINIIGVLCTLALAGVGIYGIVIALRTISEMKQQREVTMLQLRSMNEQLSEISQQTASLKEYVGETKKIAKANTDSANALMNAERPWLFISPIGFRPEPMPQNRLDWRIYNRGRTVANVIQVRLRSIHCYGMERFLKIPAEYKLTIPFHEVPVAPEGTLDAWGVIETDSVQHDRPLNVTELEHIRSGRSELVAYADVLYKDQFTGMIHQSRFCYYYAYAFGEFRINLTAPSEYHLCT